MIDAAAIPLIIGALALAALSLTWTALNRRAGRTLLIATAIGEAGVLAAVITAIAELAQGHRPDGGMPIFIGYLIGSLVILPIAAAWGMADRTRWGSAVVAVGFLVIAVLTVRMQQVWHG